ncbi:MAG: NAD(P)-dependent alcohol dehydrogenase [Rhodobacterales bacterium]|nr:NAD(P)-dependent alcohol dehydrogenase [Rhodobacterales bacterium]
MKTVTFERYGEEDVLGFKDMPRPKPKSNEILVEVRSTTVTPTDVSFRAGNPCIVRLYLGLRRPKKQVLGTEFSGVIVGTGDGARGFEIGDQVFGAPADGTGAHAQYICLPADGAVCKIPENMTLAEAAAICSGGLTALPFLRDNGQIKKGDKVLIIGASGSIGSMAVQMAKHFGAHVTGVCSARNVALVGALGADRVIDYTHQDFAIEGTQYDIIFDTVAKSSFAKARAALTPKGVYLVTAPSFATIFQMLRGVVFGGKRAVMAATGLRPEAEQRADMEQIKQWIENGVLTVLIDRSYPFGQIAEAHAFVATERKRGNVLIAMA